MNKTTKIDRQKIQIQMIYQKIESFNTLAERAGMSTNTLFRSLDGTNWSSRTLDKLAEALKCNPLDIVTTEGYPDPKANALASA